MRNLQRLISDERAATTIEYCFIAGMISIMILAGVQLIGGNITAKFLGPLANGFP